MPTARPDDYRGQPLVLVFHPAHWDPSTDAYVETYNRVVARMPGAAGARLLAIEQDDAPWRRLSFDDGALRIALIEAHADGDAPVALAARFGIGPAGGVVVLDADGTVRARHEADGALPSPDEVARTLAALAPREPADDPPPSRATGWSRREFVATALGASIALALLPRGTRAAPTARTAPGTTAAPAAPGTVRVTLRVNGRDVALTIEPRVTLLDALRERAELTGTKKGCDHGQCGACTVHVDGRRTLSCLTLAVMQQGHAITTIEGLAAADGTLHPVQQAFIAHDGFQCGYCTPGQIMSATAMMREPWGASDDDVREAMSGNLCRCGAYPGIVAAVQEARRTTTSGGEVRR